MVVSLTNLLFYRVGYPLTIQLSMPPPPPMCSLLHFIWVLLIYSLPPLPQITYYIICVIILSLVIELGFHSLDRWLDKTSKRLIEKVGTWQLARGEGLCVSKALPDY